LRLQNAKVSAATAIRYPRLFLDLSNVEGNSEAMADASPDPQDAKRLRLRKYPNRRYYDSTRSRHVTLEEIHKLIRDGYEIEVTDSKTGQDITAKVLGQIIIELDAPKMGVFPVSMLHRLLRSNEQLVQDFIHKYFNQPLTAFLDQQRNMEQVFRQAMGFQSPAPTVADWAKMMWGPFNPGLWGNGTRVPADSGPPQPNGDAGKDDLRSLVDDLREQVAELRAQKRASSKKKGR
jgi:polyhydroxyalkanoate synthesis repressor PhaR